MNRVTTISFLFLILTACGGGARNGFGAPGGGGPDGKGALEGWQVSLLGQEGHGGDAVVCFTIPVQRALYQQRVGKVDECNPNGPCKNENVENSAGPGHSGPVSGVVWRMTDEGRRSIRSAKPLEQYLAERTAAKKVLVDQLNQMSVEAGYKKILTPFQKVPAPFRRIAEAHKQLGWLVGDGIGSQYGLLDINDSGFLEENEVDRVYCKELQAVVRRDNQLWYDSDIVAHFDNAGKVLIQLHEEIYAWGKDQDKINWEIPGPLAHETSAKTRRLILKILDQNADPALVNENLKTLGFSALYWEDMFKIPTSVGFYMDADACLSEQRFLKNFIASNVFARDFWLRTELLFSDRYLKYDQSRSALQLMHNFPDALSNMIALTMAGDSATFTTDIQQLQSVFERPESCEGRF